MLLKTGLLSMLCGLLLGLATAVARPPRTVIYLVRHGEKDLTPGLADPLLTPAGEVRATTLSQQLARRHPAALFTTDTRRTRATLAPLAQATGRTPLVYSAQDPAALVTRIQQEYAGKTVVVVGHSNTLLPLLTALGVQAPMQEIKDEEFDYLFKVTLREGKPASVAVSHYGAPPHAANANSMH
jgi:broad specificity phosphatase PhoE